MGKGVKKIIAIVVILLIILGAGIMILSQKPEDKLRVPEGYHEKITLYADVTMNIVFVGFDENIVQPKTFMEHLPDSYRPTDALRSWPFGQMFFEYLSFNLSYKFYFADDEFAELLFAYANDIAEWDEPTEYLKNYDTESGQNRLDEGEDIQYVNVTAVESWINENRTGYGLKFKDPEYTLFFIDSYTKAYMPTDTYHYWKFYEDYSGGEATTNMRAWGGNYNFLWLDVGAAPSYFNEDSAETDPPIWHYDSTTWAEFNEHMATDAKFALQYRFIPGYIYHPVNKHVYVNSHIWVDDVTLIPSGFEENLDFNVVLERLTTLMPWVEWKGEHHIYYLPDDDPGMEEALKKAKWKDAPKGILSSKPVMNYITRNVDKYGKTPEGYQNIWVNLFILKGAESFDTLASNYGMAAPGPDGKPWGVIGLINDFGAAQMSDEQKLAWFYILEVHEVGHIVGLRHPHDGVLNENGTYESGPQFWLWDQSATTMSYRIDPYGGDQLDRNQLARGHTVLNIHEAHKNLDAVYENLRAEGRGYIIGNLLKKVRDAEENVGKSINSFQAGKWINAVEYSYKALNCSREAVEISGGITYVTSELTWSNTITHVGGYYDSIPVNPYNDYKKIDGDIADEWFEVEVTWDNGLASAADLYVGWSFDGTPGAVFDLNEEQRKEIIGSVEKIRINLDDQGIREAGSIYVGMGFYRGEAVALEYNVKVTVYSRMNGKIV